MILDYLYYEANVEVRAGSLLKSKLIFCSSCFLTFAYTMSVQIPLALLNARMSLASFERWSAPPIKPLVAAMLARFSLIAPLVLFFPALCQIDSNPVYNNATRAMAMHMKLQR